MYELCALLATKTAPRKASTRTRKSISIGALVMVHGHQAVVIRKYEKDAGCWVVRFTAPEASGKNIWARRDIITVL